MQPGKPQGFGLIGDDRTPMIMLPGNPVSAFVSFEAFVRPVIRKLMGARRTCGQVSALRHGARDELDPGPSAARPRHRHDDDEGSRHGRARRRARLAPARRSVPRRTRWCCCPTSTEFVAAGTQRRGVAAASRLMSATGQPGAAGRSDRTSNAGRRGADGRRLRQGRHGAYGDRGRARAAQRRLRRRAAGRRGAQGRRARRRPDRRDQAAKRTPDLDPALPPAPISGVEVLAEVTDDGVELTATVRTTDRTGVEMEALTAVSVAGLAVIDMIKAIDRDAVITDVRVVAKSGGRSGD